MFDPHFLNYIASYDVASSIWQALGAGGEGGGEG